MPSSGYGIVDLFEKVAQEHQHTAALVVLECAEIARKHGLFIEWLESFVAAWEKTHDCVIAANAGLHEWDM